MSETSLYPVFEPPTSVSALDTKAWNSLVRVDYATHPAYAAMVADAPWTARVAALKRFVATWVLVSLKRHIQYELIPLHVRRGGGWRLLRAALGHLGRPRPGRHFGIDEASLPPLQRNLSRDGCAVLAITAADLDRVTALSRPHFDALRARRASPREGPREFEASRGHARRDEDSALFEAIESIFATAGVLDCATQYLGRRARLVDVNPQINDASDDFWRRIFPDGAAPHPTTAYLHRDASGGDLKAILYLCDVGADNGPFGYVVGSHRLAPPPADDRICETNDSNGLAATDPASRRLFAALPQRWRQKGAVGNDLTDATPPSAALLAALWSIHAKKGAVVLFDTKGMHRGGMVTAGERCVITCVIG